MTDSVSLRAGDLWECLLSHEPESTIACHLLGTSHHQSHDIHFDRSQKTSFTLVKKDDYRTRDSRFDTVEILSRTELTMYRGSQFTLRCIAKGGPAPAYPWRILYPGSPIEAANQCSVWIDRAELRVDRSEPGETEVFRVSKHPSGWEPDWEPDEKP
jgi:hypothetical protein